jgi:glycosyltransferase involved in cell wall biosynthesis
MQDNKQIKVLSTNDFESLNLRTEEEIMSSWAESQDPIVSCCAISFNHQDYIEFALKSILMQETDFSLEIIIRDDASTDKTQQIISQYQAKYPNIIKPILEQENGYSKGLKPRMIIMSQAKGTYIAPLDCDDYWTRSDKLQKQVDFLRTHEDYALCFHNACVVDNTNQVIKEKRFINAKDLSSEDLIIGRSTILPSFAVFKNIGFDSDFPEEFTGIKNGDTLTWHLIGFAGQGKYLNDFNAGAFRSHAQGQNTGLSEFSKKKNRIQTRHAIICSLQKHNEFQLKQSCFTVLEAFSTHYLGELIKGFEVRAFFKTFNYFPKIFGLKLPKMILRATFVAIFKRRSITKIQKA